MIRKGDSLTGVEIFGILWNMRSCQERATSDQGIDSEYTP